ncbi:ParB/RepB/Spo0J family partition protein [Streptomyces xanthophaeus]|uniref:ParB/RepB/Spo0J family partition protein n=1 Tax=Streptomyces xanthophaeus TaxID=67385 RepID=UPI00371BD60A
MTSNRQTAADRVGVSSSFGGIRSLSSRGQMIAQATGEAPEEKFEESASPPGVQLHELAHNPFNPREELTDLTETAESLRVRGQLQPIAVVRRAAFLAVHPDQAELLGDAAYVVIDGNRRLAAAEVAGLQSLRIDVNDNLAASAHDMLESALIANVHRVDVPPIDQARAIKELLEVHRTQTLVAARLGKTEAWVSQRLALLGLTEDLQNKVESGALTVKDGRRIGRLPAGEQHAEAEKALNRVKTPRKPRSQAAVGSAGELIPGGTPVPLVPAPSPDGDGAVGNPEEHAPILNPVKTVHETGTPDLDPRTLVLPWTEPEWFNARLREHMTAEHREQLVLLLMAD